MKNTLQNILRNVLLTVLTGTAVWAMNTADCLAKEPASVCLMSYNIRIGNVNDGTNSWEYRYPASAMMVSDQMPDIVGYQEALAFQVSYMKDYVLGYKVIGSGKDRGKTKCAHMTMQYNPKTVSAGKWGTFWLSETPEKASMGWDAAYERSATWVVFKHKSSGKRFIVVNTHLDDQGAEARREGLKLILSKIEKINPDALPVVLMGDFNMQVDDAAMESVKAVMTDARSAAVSSDDTHSFHGWGKARSTIDYIWYRGFDSCISFETVTKPYMERKFISDHYPVKATLML